MKKGISKKKPDKTLIVAVQNSKLQKSGGELKGDASLSLSPLPPHHTG